MGGSWLGERSSRMSRSRTSSRSLTRQIEEGLDAAYREATETMVKNMQRDDAREGISAFLEKRDMPEWQDR